MKQNKDNKHYSGPKHTPERLKRIEAASPKVLLNPIGSGG